MTGPLFYGRSHVYILTVLYSLSKIPFLLVGPVVENPLLLRSAIRSIPHSDHRRHTPVGVRMYEAQDSVGEMKKTFPSSLGAVSLWLGLLRG